MDAPSLASSGSGLVADLEELKQRHLGDYKKIMKVVKIVAETDTL